MELTYPEDVPHLLALIGAIRDRVKPGYLLANRGFGPLPGLADFARRRAARFGLVCVVSDKALSRV